ncbi:hypothetical protein [Sutcliffiella horikoshii]|uniref:hypothetical protein n=1 Tax=Sutcliffiella horikoshii TaxID=79883 RepID=UPI001F44EB32|nr:hypothetical protein [Sutcliffiella horikoshii]MCG1022892.1 hypothetical protein [Sutcliffiella horikoshii]
MEKWRGEKYNIIGSILIGCMVAGVAIYYVLFYTPKNSLELYQAIRFSKSFEESAELMLEGYNENFSEKDYDFMSQLENTPNRITQFTLFEYKEKTYLIMTTPGTSRLQVLDVKELPEEVRHYFLALPED